jgi:ankyrin repeat protein
MKNSLKLSKVKEVIDHYSKLIAANKFSRLSSFDMFKTKRKANETGLNESVIQVKNEKNYSYQIKEANPPIYSAGFSPSGFTIAIVAAVFAGTALGNALYERDKQKKIDEFKKRLNKDKLLPIPDKQLLHYAAYEGEEEIVRLLIEKKFDVNAKDEYGNTPLHWIARANWKQIESDYRVETIIDLLVRNGADINSRNGNGRTPLHTAAKIARYSTIERLLHHKAEINAKDDAGLTPLHMVFDRNNYERDVIKAAIFLIYLGADVNAKGKYYDDSVLFMVIDYFEHKSKNSYEYSVYERDCLFKTLKDAELNVNPEDPSLHPFTLVKDTQLARMFENMGAKIPKLIDGKTSPLAQAVSEGNLDLIEFFCIRIDDVNITDANKTPILHCAVRKNDVNNFLMLIRHGADINVKDEKGMNAIHNLAYNDDYFWREMNEKELGALVKRNLLNKTNMNLIFSNPTYGHNFIYKQQLMLDILVSNNANINEQDINGNTPLHIAAKDGGMKVLRSLIEAGAKLNITNKEGLTPVSIAIQEFDKHSRAPGSKTNLEMANFLIKQGVNLTDHDRQIMKKYPNVWRISGNTQDKDLEVIR